MKRPSCGQCLQRRTICAGYGQGITFVHDHRAVSSASQPSVPVDASDLSQTQTPLSCFQSAAQIGMTDYFWYLYLPRKQASPSSIHGSLDEFYQAAGHLADGDGIGKHTFWALSSLIIGREVNDSRLLLESAKMYGLALKEMQLALQAPRGKSFDKLTMTANLLALYEVS